MSKDKAIIPTEQRTVEFHGDMVTAVVVNGDVFVPVKPLCELIGVDWAAQFTKIKNDTVLSDVSMSVGITQQTSDGSKRPNTSTMIALPLSHLNGWLFSINAKRVKDEIRDALIRYQRDCYTILFEAFTTGVATKPDDDIMQSPDESAVTYRHLVQMARLAREHYYLTKQVDDNTKRIGLIEAQLSNPAAYVTNEQAQLISSAVKSIATMLGKVSGRNEFGAVYGELYQRYGVTSYKQIAAVRFDDVIGWLRDWWVVLTDDLDAPF